MRNGKIGKDSKPGSEGEKSVPSQQHMKANNYSSKKWPYLAFKKNQVFSGQQTLDSNGRKLMSFLHVCPMLLDKRNISRAYLSIKDPVRTK